jgi:hypothetical protein
MKLGAEPKKVIILTVLFVVGGYVVYSNLTSDDAPPRSPRPQSAESSTRSSAVAAGRSEQRPAARTRGANPTGREFKPTLRPRGPEERLDPMTIDPTLRLDLLAKLQKVAAEDKGRSVFDFSEPPPKDLEPKINPKAAAEAEAKAKAEEEAKAAAAPPAPPVKPPPPPINLKYYGFISPANSPTKRAFFLEGDEIYVAGEGDLIKKKYKVVRIGVNSAVVEDTEHQNQQTIALVEQRG